MFQAFWHFGLWSALWNLLAMMFRGGAALLIVACLPFVGCQLFKPNTEPLERGFTGLMTEVVKPAVEKAGDELSARTAQLQGQGSLIDPGYEVSGYAGFFQGALYRLEIRAVGVSANLAGAAQADAGQPGSVPPPAIRTPAEIPPSSQP